MRALLIDNHDSFTFNLFQLLAEVNEAEPIVVGNDAAGWEELSRLGCDCVVLSPGPGRPERRRDFGVCAEVIRRCEVPLLGVCLGHQGIGWAHGARVVPAPEPVHGRVDEVTHGGAPLFAGIPRRFHATRYHSLSLARPLPPEIEEIAVSADGVAMALAHRRRPQWGVQFHPESVGSEYGRRLLENFRDLARLHPGARRRPGRERPAGGSGRGCEPPATALPPAPRRLSSRALDWGHDPERAFLALYADSDTCFWLDGSGPGGGRFSFMGDARGPLGALASYDVDAGEVTIARAGTAPEARAETIFDYLERELALPAPPSDELPFEFRCGFAGYLGYELKADCGGEPAHRSPLPDAALIFADRVLAFDRESGRVHLVCLHEEADSGPAEAWLEATEERLARLREAPFSVGPAAAPTPSDLRFGRPRRRYLEDVAECHRLLREGESYEVCLTDRLTGELDADPLVLYRRLRRLNPAPFSSYLRFGRLAVLSSSPERFLRVSAAGDVEARPIKGTRRRDPDPDRDAGLAHELRGSRKDRAENLMIVDLVRNDLGRVCEVGSVVVPGLGEVETFATVHQLVSTVRGRLRSGTGVVDCVRACFPPGSMTGAPKRRTMEVLDRLEGGPRGVYSGAIGYFGLDGGCDLSVAIRTIVLDGGRVSIGAGGAVVLQSSPEEEYEEMLLKARAAGLALAP